ncbi:MAG: hypothetical protein HOQ24_17175 [Mycobacteriaceae bacterium]|nr:hypothetical protein [Mycobacteriaceae bacterium]
MNWATIGGITGGFIGAAVAPVGPLGVGFGAAAGEFIGSKFGDHQSTSTALTQAGFAAVIGGGAGLAGMAAMRSLAPSLLPRVLPKLAGGVTAAAGAVLTDFLLKPDHLRRHRETIEIPPIHIPKTASPPFQKYLKSAQDVLDQVVSILGKPEMTIELPTPPPPEPPQPMPASYATTQSGSAATGYTSARSSLHDQALTSQQADLDADAAVKQAVTLSERARTLIRDEIVRLNVVLSDAEKTGPAVIPASTGGGSAGQQTLPPATERALAASVYKAMTNVEGLTEVACREADIAETYVPALPGPTGELAPKPSGDYVYPDSQPPIMTA